MSVNPNDANSIKASFPGYAGWNDTASIIADFKATGGAGKGAPSSGSSTSNTNNSGGYSASNAIDTAKQLLQFQIDANKPAIETLNSGIGGVQSAFQGQRETLSGQKTTLEDRYQALLKDITQSTNQSTALEFGRRGIPTTSGLLESTVASKLAPQISQAGIAKESDINNIDALIASLTGQETSQVNSIKGAIANLQAGAGGSATSDAMKLLGLQQNQDQFNKTSALDELKASLSAGANQPNVQTINVGGVGYVLNPITGEIIRKLTGGGSGSSANSNPLGL